MLAVRPFPATIRFRLKDPDCDGYPLLSLSTDLLSAGLILREPRELRRPVDDPASLELTCTFVDATASLLWEARSGLEEWFADNLRESPQIIAYRDAYFDSDEVRVCACCTREGLLFQGDALECTGPLVCLSCRGFLSHYSWPRIRGLGTWSSVHQHVYQIWLASDTLESWARSQLFEWHSELNRDGYALSRATAETMGCPVYFLVPTQEDERQVCPGCHRPGEPAPWTQHPRQRCRECFVAY